MEGPDELRPRRARLWHDWFRQAVRREHSLRPDRPRRALRDQPRRGRRPRLGPSRGRADAIAPGRGRDRLRRQAGARPLLATAGQRGAIARSSRWPSGSPRRSWASASNAPSATSTRSTAGPRPTTGRSRTSSRTCSSASPPTGSPRPPRLLDERRKADPSGALPPIPRLREVYRLGPVLPPARRPRHRPPARPARPGRARAARRRRPARAALRLAGGARQPLLRPQLRQPRLGRLLRRGPGRPGRRLLGHQPALERRGCSTPWRPTSSPTATTSAGSSERS